MSDFLTNSPDHNNDSDGEQTSQKSKKSLILLLLSIVLNIGLVVWIILLLLRSPYYQLTLSEGNTLTLGQVVNPNLNLVPKGTDLSGNRVDEYTYSIQVSYHQLVSFNAEVLPLSKAIGSIDNSYNHLLRIQLYEVDTPQHLEAIETLRSELDGSNKTFVSLVHVRVFVVAPDDSNDYQEAYDAISGQTISFTLGFNITQ